MRPDIKNDLLYLLRILEACQKIKLYSRGFSNSENFYYSNDQLELNACLHQMAQIEEQAKKISSTLIDKYPKIPWAKIKGFRNRIIHEYVGIDLENAFKVIQTEVPDLHNEVVSIVSTELLIGTFEREEFDVAKTSPYLKHIDFSLF